MTASEIKNIILSAVALTGTFIAKALGGWDSAMTTLVIIMAIDYITGVLIAIAWKKSPKSATGAADSTVGFKGLCKKGVILLVILIAVRLDITMNLAGVVRLASIMFFIGNEGISVIENLGIMGVPFPNIIKESLEKLKAKGDKEDEDNS